MVLKLLVVCIGIHLSDYGFCFAACRISSSAMWCKGSDFPSKVPYRVQKVFIEGIDCDRLKAFKNVSHVQILDITAKEGLISAGCFSRFSNLSYIGIHVQEDIYIDRNAFEGVSTVKTLNLSSNPRLDESFIISALHSESRDILPNLEHLSISRIKTSVVIPVDLNFSFFKSITVGRSLKSLDISHLNINRLDHYSARSACTSIEDFDMSKSVIGSVTNIPINYTCQSLRKINISGMILPVLRTKFSFQSFSFFCQTLKFYERLKILYLDYTNTEQDIVITNYSLEMSTCPIELQKVSSVGNRIRWVDFIVNLHNKTIQGFTELNVSDNGMEYISPSVMLPSKNLVILDISKNRLSNMQEQYTDEFEKLFWAQENVKYLYLSRNGFKHIPRNTFSKNKVLKVLDLSYNNIIKLDFSVDQLIYLEKLFLNNNRIKHIQPSERIELENLLPGVTDDGGKEEFHVYLEGNKFECNCDNENQKFIKWLHVSKVINANETINCFLDGDNTDIKSSAPTATERFCRIEAIKRISMIAVPLFVAVLVLGIVIALYVRRWQRNKTMIREVIAQIKNGTFPMHYLAFLSYCSEDAALVLNMIYPRLQEHLSEITHSNEQLVCIGDKYFRPGFPLICEVMRCVEDSSVLIAVISRNYCQKKFCMIELKEACEQNKPVIMLMVEHVEKELMEDFLQKVFDRYTHASWKPGENGGNIEPEWKIFCQSILQLSGAN